MQDFFHNIFSWFVDRLDEEWFVAIIALIVTLLISLTEQKTGNRITRSDFIYRINGDYASNEQLLKVYNWIEKCCRKNEHTPNYRLLKDNTEASVFSEESEVDFTDIDTYINLFESVYVIRKAVKMENLDKLFQQRFLTLMHNPYVQREILFPGFVSNENVFSLYKIWLKMPYKRCHFNSFRFAEYLSQYTCGSYEYVLDRENYRKLSPLKKLHRRWVQIHYIRDFVPNICDPDCKYGFYRLTKTNRDTGNPESLTVRIIRSNPTDLEDLLDLQERVVAAMGEHAGYYVGLDREELERMLSDHYCIPIQLDVNKRIAAFALLILRPEEPYILSTYADGSLRAPSGIGSILETVFVDPAYRGYGMQSLLIDILSRLAHYRKASTVWATVHPDNSFSYRNFERNDFKQATKAPIDRYGSADGVRRLYCRDVTHLSMKDKKTGKYCIYPEL